MANEGAASVTKHTDSRTDSRTIDGDAIAYSCIRANHIPVQRIAGTALELDLIRPSLWADDRIITRVDGMILHVSLWDDLTRIPLG
jgi:hypothetical protein